MDYSRIDRLSVTDHEEIIRVWEDSVRATHHFLAERDIRFFKEKIREVYLFHVGSLWGVRSGTGDLMAFAGVTDRELDMLFIHPDYRGKGVGRLLLTFAVEMLGVRQVDVNEQNKQALEFYLHMGFEVIGKDEVDGTGKPFPILHMRKKI